MGMRCARLNWILIVDGKPSEFRGTVSGARGRIYKAVREGAGVASMWLVYETHCAHYQTRRKRMSTVETWKEDWAS